MKKLFYSILASLTLALAVSCSEDDKATNESIQINIDQSPSDFAPVNLDGDWPKFSGNISADDNLTKVSFLTDDEMFFEVSSFDGNAKSHSFDVDVPWALGISFVRVVAESASGDVIESQRKVNVKGGPGMSIELTELEIDLSVNPTETITGTISSASGLAEVVYTLTENGTATTYKTINPTGESASEFSISEEITFALGAEKFHILATDTKGNIATHSISINVVESPVFQMFSYTGIELHGTDKRTTGVSIGVSLIDGKEHDWDAIIGDTNAKEIDLMIASADSSIPKVRYFSPLKEYGDKFKLGDGNADLVLNETVFSILDRGDGDFFDAATTESIRAMTLTDEDASTTDHLQSLESSASNGVDILNGSVVYFETEWGAQCLVRITEVTDNNGNRKGDSYTLDFKVVYQTN